MVKKSTTKVVETKFPDLPEEVNTYMPPKLNTNKQQITILPSTSNCQESNPMKDKKEKKEENKNTKNPKVTILPVSVPEVKLSPMRTRLLERSNEKVILEEKKPEKKKKEKKEGETKEKPKKKVVVDVKSPPKVFKSPTWYKSPSKKVVKEEDLVFKQILLKDPKLTERDISKILQDHKS
jgi:hypothetical protein